MNPEFQKVGPNSAKSDKGFTATWRPSGGVDYSDANDTVRVDSELMIKPSRILVYLRSGAVYGGLTDEAGTLDCRLENWRRVVWPAHAPRARATWR